MVKATGLSSAEECKGKKVKSYLKAKLLNLRKHDYNYFCFYSQFYYTLSEKFRSFDFDHLTAPNGYVITGLKFDTSKDNHVNIKVLISSFLPNLNFGL